jgi:heme-degrading monooxygenase HmoA
MISLNCYFDPKPGREAQLKSAIIDAWIVAMAEQPGFINAALLTPFSDEELANLEAAKAQAKFEVVSFWRSEEERLAWVARPIHDEVFNPVIAESDRVTYTLHNVVESWSI